MSSFFRSYGLALVFWLLAAVFGGLVFWLGFHPLPALVRITLLVPAGAEVLPRERVKPGTFDLETSVQEIVRLAADKTAPAQRAIVAFGQGTGATDNVAVIEYWLPRGDGSSAFYHTRLLHRAPFESRAVLRSVRREGEMLVLTPTMAPLPVIANMFMACLFGAIGLAVSSTWWRRR